MALPPVYTGPMKTATDYRQSHQNSLPPVSSRLFSPAHVVSRWQHEQARSDPLVEALRVRPTLHLPLPLLSAKNSYIYERKEGHTYPYPHS